MIGSKVTQVMRDNAKTLDTLVKLRLKNAKTMTSVEDIKSYGKIAAAHALCNAHRLRGLHFL